MRLFSNYELPKVERIIELPDDECATQRINNMFHAATEDEMSRGINWYADAHLICTDLADSSGIKHLTPLHVAGIMAALSPMRSWKENIEKTRQVVETGTTTGLGHTVVTANLIWHGIDPHVVIERTGENLKVMSFFDNIAYPESSQAVTIDRHMWTLLFADPKIVQKADLYFKPHEYMWAVDIFRKVAAEHGYLPHQVQAVTWLAWRRQQGIVDASVSADQLQLDL